jgi:hypothetical protein
MVFAHRRAGAKKGCRPYGQIVSQAHTVNHKFGRAEQVPEREQDPCQRDVRRESQKYQAYTR